MLHCLEQEKVDGLHLQRDGNRNTETEKQKFGVQYLAQEHFNMQTGGAGAQTTDLTRSGRSALTLEPQPPQSKGAFHIDPSHIVLLSLTFTYWTWVTEQQTVYGI